MKDIRRGVCPLCEHNQVVQSWPIDHSYAGDNWNVAAAEVTSWRKTTQYGPMSTFICRSCGFTQWFSADPETIPIGKEHNTVLIEGPPR